MTGPAVKAHGFKPLQRPSAVLIVVVLAGLFVTWTGCSVEKHYELLSFFFDGVPDPDAPEPGSGGIFARAASEEWFIHQPFGEGTCIACHVEFTDLTRLRGDSTVCLQCHAGTPNQHVRMHGPVAAGGCLWCHDPHQSTHPAILRQSAPELCQRCHSGRLLEPAHGGAPLERFSACLDCHYGHGGDAAFFLKNAAGVMPPPPDTEPRASEGP